MKRTAFFYSIALLLIICYSGCLEEYEIDIELPFNEQIVAEILYIENSGWIAEITKSKPYDKPISDDNPVVVEEILLFENGILVATFHYEHGEIIGNYIPVVDKEYYIIIKITDFPDIESEPVLTPRTVQIDSIRIGEDFGFAYYEDPPELNWYGFVVKRYPLRSNFVSSGLTTNIYNDLNFDFPTQLEVFSLSSRDDSVRVSLYSYPEGLARYVESWNQYEDNFGEPLLVPVEVEGNLQNAEGVFGIVGESYRVLY